MHGFWIESEWEKVYFLREVRKPLQVKIKLKMLKRRKKETMGDKEGKKKLGSER